MARFVRVNGTAFDLDRVVRYSYSSGRTEVRLVIHLDGADQVIFKAPAEGYGPTPTAEEAETRAMIAAMLAFLDERLRPESLPPSP